MPRPNPHRTIESELSLARRVTYEREVRGWSYEGLASRMAQVGCPIHASALHKIEKANPPRRITVDEMVAYSRVFEIPLPGLLNPPEKVLNRELTGLLKSMATAIDQTIRADRAYKESLAALAEFVLEHPETVEHLDASDGFSLSVLIETLRDLDSDEDRRLLERLERLAT